MARLNEKLLYLLKGDDVQVSMKVSFKILTILKSVFQLWKAINLTSGQIAFKKELTYLTHAALLVQNIGVELVTVVRYLVFKVLF